MLSPRSVSAGQDGGSTTHERETRDERKETELCWFLADTVHRHSPHIPIYDVREIIGKNQKENVCGEKYYLIDTRLR